MHICVHVYVCTYWYKDPCAAGSMRMWFVSHSNHLNFEARHHPFRVTPSFREATPSGARTRRDDWPGMVERVCPQMGHSHTPQLSFLTSCLHTCFFYIQYKFGTMTMSTISGNWAKNIFKVFTKNKHHHISDDMGDPQGPRWTRTSCRIGQRPDRGLCRVSTGLLF
jgi:hypothetical protein